MWGIGIFMIPALLKKTLPLAICSLMGLALGTVAQARSQIELVEELSGIEFENEMAVKEQAELKQANKDAKKTLRTIESQKLKLEAQTDTLRSQNHLAAQEHLELNTRLQKANLQEQAAKKQLAQAKQKSQQQKHKLALMTEQRKNFQLQMQQIAQQVEHLRSAIAVEEQRYGFLMQRKAKLQAALDRLKKAKARYKRVSGRI